MFPSLSSLTLFTVLLLLLVGPGWAQELELFKGEHFEGGPWTIKADKIIYDVNTRTYEAQGRVDIRQGNRRITADYIRVNETTKIATVRGHVVVVLEGDIFTGQTGHFNLATRCGELENARLFLKRNHFHVDSALIRKTGEYTYHAERCVVTTCDADRPVWSFYARELDVVLEGYATGKSTVMRVGPLPVLYLPYAALPVKTIRQSGLLMPQFGQHRAGGTVVELPFYWAINNHSDATLYQMLISSRGYMQGVEYRYAWNKKSGGTMRFSYIRDGEEEAPTSHRYWVAGMLDQELPGNWQTKLTVDRVSDRRYLRDFNFGYLGLNRYSDTLLETYGRGLEAEDVKTRVSSLLLTRNFSLANLTAFSRYYQRLLTENPRPWHKVPALNLSSLRLPLRGWPLQLGFDSSYTHYFQNHGLTGHRLDLHPQVLLPVRLLGAVDFETCFGLRETAYRVDNRGDQPELATYLGRQLYDLKINLGTVLCRDYGRRRESSEFVRHIVRPEVTYWNMPDYNADRLPPFNPWDLGWRDKTNRNLPILEGDNPLGGVNAVTYALTNSFLRRYTDSQARLQVRELLWLRLSQSCFFNSASMGLDGIPQPHHRFSDILAESWFYPIDNLSIGVDLGTSPYREGLNRVDLKFLYQDLKRQNYLGVDYLYLKNYAQQINTVVFLNLFRSIKTWITHQHTFITEQRIETQYGLVFQRQCWGLSLNFADRADDKRVSFMIFIPGLGEKLLRAPVQYRTEM